MSAPQRAFNLFAYRKDDADYTDDVRRDGIHPGRLEDAVAWAFGRGCDTVLVERADHPARGSALVTHHICSDPSCPGGC